MRTDGGANPGAAATLLTPNQFASIQGSADAKTAPTPMKKLCRAKPAVRCSSASASPTNARNGSMVTLIDASMTQSIRAATQSAGELGIISKDAVVRIAPKK